MLVCGNRAKEDREERERWKILKQKIHQNRHLFNGLFEYQKKSEKVKPEKMDKDAVF